MAMYVILLRAKLNHILLRGYFSSQKRTWLSAPVAPELYLNTMSLEEFNRVKVALAQGRSSKVEISADISRLSADTHDTYSEHDDGYDTDCVSVDEYIDGDDLFWESTFLRKRVTSALPPSTSNRNKKMQASIAPTKERNEFQFSDEEILELEKINKYFREVIDRHVLTIERY